MRRLSVFNNVSLDGYFTDRNGDMSWAHRSDAEWSEFSRANAQGNSVLVFGRVTYDMMAGFWPSPAAMQTNSALAERMNGATKIVFSRTLQDPAWNNTTAINGDIAEEIHRLKREPGPDMVILGSGMIVSQLTEVGLIDDYRLAVLPLILGGGRTLFERVSTRPILKLMSARTFANGNVFLCYERSA